MLIDKFRIFENIDFDAVSEGNYELVKEQMSELGIELDESIWSTFRNYVSRVLGGRVKDIDKLLRDYYDNEMQYWENWADAKAKYSEADILFQEIKNDPVQKYKYEEQRNRAKTLIEQVEKTRNDVNNGLMKQANTIVKNNERMMDYLEMAKAKMDEKVARETYEKLKNISDKEVSEELYKRIEQTVNAARKKDQEFQSAQRTTTSVTPLEPIAPTIKVEDEIPSTITVDTIDKIVYADFTDKMKEQLLKMPTKNLKVLQEYMMKEQKRIKDIKSPEGIKQREELDAKVAYINKILAVGNLVTSKTENEIGKDGVNSAVHTLSKLGAEQVEKLVDSKVRKYFKDGKPFVENALGENIEERQYELIQDDLMSLLGKLTMFYKAENKSYKLVDVRSGLLLFAGDIYKYKKEHNSLAKPLKKGEIELLFQEYNRQNA